MYPIDVSGKKKTKTKTKRRFVTAAKILSSVYGSIVKNPQHVGRRTVSTNVDL